ncbi:MAG: hypothetical protein ACR2PR_08035 [Pseudohongiellaceae bacterium]
MTNPQKPIQSFSVPPELFNALVNYLLDRPYREVNQLLNGMERDCKAVFPDEDPPPADPPEDPPGKIVDDPEPGQEDLGDGDPPEDVPLEELPPVEHRALEYRAELDEFCDQYGYHFAADQVDPKTARAFPGSEPLPSSPAILPAIVENS